MFMTSLIFTLAQATQPTPPIAPGPSFIDRVLGPLLAPFQTWTADYPNAQMWTGIVLILLIAVVVHVAVGRCIPVIARLLMRKRPKWWGDVFVQQRVIHRLELLIPMFIVERGLTLIPHLSEQTSAIIFRIAMAILVLLIAGTLGALLTSVNIIYSRYPIALGRPIKGYLQVVKILLYVAAGVMVITALFNLQPFWFLSGMGAMMAVILLVFRDTLLSLVAGIQLVNNDLVRVGDWIEMSEFSADGDVVDISLNFVKVSNWDKTMTVIPAHQFLNHSFRNWRFMSENGGRRIKRSIHIDMSSIDFLTSDQITRFSRFKLLKQYIQDKSNDISAYNKEHVPADSADIIANARHLTNVGTLRAYIANYLKAHPDIHQEMTLLVRQLAPTTHGLPIEIYVFTNNTAWGVYEGIQADIFDHILSIVPQFGLRLYQQPGGSDVQALRPVLQDRSQDKSAGPDNLGQDVQAIRPLGLD